MGQRLTTILVLALVGALVVAVVVDTERGGGQHDRSVRGPAPRVERLNAGVLSGRLLYADTGCRVVQVDLATLSAQTLTRSGGHCRFWPSPDGHWLAMHIGRPFVPPLPLELLDMRTGRITRPLHRPDFAVAPPAWSADSRTLAVCDARNPGERLVRVDVVSGRVSPVRRDACFPAYAAGKLAYREVGGEVDLDGRTLADAGTLTRLLGFAVDQIPGITGQDSTLAVPTTRVTVPGAAPPLTTVVLYDGADGKVSQVWQSGVIAQEVNLLDGGRIVAARADDRLVIRTLSGRRLSSAGDQPIVAATASPDGRTLALATPARLILADAETGAARFSLPIATTWVAWR
ncbi:MAG: TolB family protein [Gaiellales bacterium]